MQTYRLYILHSQDVDPLADIIRQSSPSQAFRHRRAGQRRLIDALVKLWYNVISTFAWFRLHRQEVD